MKRFLQEQNCGPFRRLQACARALPYSQLKDVKLTRSMLGDAEVEAGKQSWARAPLFMLCSMLTGRCHQLLVKLVAEIAPSPIPCRHLQTACAGIRLSGSFGCPPTGSETAGCRCSVSEPSVYRRCRDAGPMLDIACPSFLTLCAVLLHFVCKAVDFLGPQYMTAARADNEVVAPTDASDDVDDHTDDGAEAHSLLTGSQQGMRDDNPYMIHSRLAFEEPRSSAPSAGAGFWAS